MNEDAAVRAWTPLAYRIAARFYLPGSDRDDVQQEALIGLWKALRDFNGSGVKAAFLAMAVNRHLATKVKQAGRDKHRPLNEAIRVALDEDGETVPIVDLLEGQRSEGGSAANQLVAMRLLLTPLERRAVVGVACGMAYAELGEFRSVDNALQRARRKLRAA